MASSFPVFIDGQRSWAYIFSVCVFLIAALAAFANALTLLALRRRHGLHQVLGMTTFMLVRCMSTIDLLDAIIGLPFIAIDGLFGDSPLITPFWCGVLIEPSIMFDNAGIWYLLDIALVRLLLITMPVRAKRLLTSNVVNVCICATPVVLSLFPAIFGLATLSYRFDKFYGRCIPMPYAYDPDSLARFALNYQFVSLLMVIVIPLPFAFAAYVSIYLVLFIRHRRQQLKKKKNAIASTTAANATTAPTTAATATQATVATSTAADDTYRRRLNVVTILAGVYVCNLLCAAPVYALWFSGSYDSQLGLVKLIISDLIQLVYLMALPLNAVTYGLTSKDFKQAYKKVLSKWIPTKNNVAATNTTSTDPAGGAAAAITPTQNQVVVFGK